MGATDESALIRRASVNLWPPLFRYRLFRFNNEVGRYVNSEYQESFRLIRTPSSINFMTFSIEVASQ
jgi:hypothetical protein